ncbi:hypothetical protein BDW74DRAFT_148988 [Aspergillus multicolor]|uniref:uncharacterized protein n=1 Tax=Aspergillus multicolor TaxID=41759 RepID=UPI003CCE2488
MSSQSPSLPNSDRSLGGLGGLFQHPMAGWPGGRISSSLISCVIYVILISSPNKLTLRA